MKRLTLCILSVAAFCAFSLLTMNLSASEKSGKEKTPEKQMKMNSHLQAEAEQAARVAKSKESTSKATSSFTPSSVLLESIRRKAELDLLGQLNQDRSNTKIIPKNLACINFDPHLEDFLRKHIPSDIKDIVEKIKNEDYYKNFTTITKNYLFIGKPGVGKSTLAKLIAKLCGIPCLMFSASSLVNKFQNAGNVHIQEIFEDARNLKQPCLVVIDEIQELIKCHNKEDTDRSVLTEIWQQLDLCKNLPITFIGAFNEVKEIPEPLRTRCKKIEIPLPTQLQRRTHLQFLLNSYQDIAFQNKQQMNRLLDEVSRRTNDFTPRDIEMLVASVTFKEAKKKKEETENLWVYDPRVILTLQHFEDGLKEFSSQKNRQTWGDVARMVGRGIQVALPFAGLGVAIAGVYYGIQANNNSLELSRKIAEKSLELQQKAFELQKEQGWWNKWNPWFLLGGQAAVAAFLAIITKDPSHLKGC